MRRLAAALVLAVLPIGAQAATLAVKVEGVTAQGGVLRVTLWDTATFDGSKPLQGIPQPARAGEMSATFTGLKPGDYAVKVLQDVNSNGKADRNILGMPTEPFGFTNAPGLITHAPSFGEIKFAVHDGENVVVIRLR